MNKNSSRIFVSCIAVMLPIFLSCTKDSPIVSPDSSLSYSIEVKEVSCTEVFLAIRSSTVSNNTISIMRDSVLILQSKILSDTIIIDSGLAPSHQYKYLLISGSSTYSATAVTMDTTSHEFSWQYFEFGDQYHGSGGFSDIAIINDTLAYAVGIIYSAETGRRDSLGNWVDSHNVARWNGQSWEQLSVHGYFNGYTTYGFIGCVLRYDSNDIWFGPGNIIRWNAMGPSFMSTLLTGVAIKMCVDDMKNVYLVGSGGAVSYYDGTKWQQESSGTSLDLVDVYGRDGTVVAAGSDPSLGKGIILERNNSQWHTLVEGDVIDPNQIFKPKLYASTQSVWIDEKGTIYAAGNLLYQYKFNQWDYVKSLSGNNLSPANGRPWSFLHRVRGNKSNDFWIVGERNTLLHFNGMTWKQIGFLYDGTSDINWRSIDVSEKLCVVVGNYGNQPVAMVVKYQ